MYDMNMPKMNKPFRWALVNGAVFAALLSGIYYNIPFLETAGLVLLWFTALGGSLIWVIINTAEYFLRQKKFSIMVTDPELLPDDRTRAAALKEDNIFFVSAEALAKIALGSVSKKLDATFDVVAVALLIYLGYSWLPIFYIFHILGLWDIRTFAEKQLFNYLEAQEKFEQEEQEGPEGQGGSFTPTRSQPFPPELLKEIDEVIVGLKTMNSKNSKDMVDVEEDGRNL